MILDFYGIIGLGLVWGWYLGMFVGRVYQPQYTLPAVFTASLVVSLYVLWYSGVSGLALLAISLLSGLCINGLWRRELQMRCRPLPSSKICSEAACCILESRIQSAP